MKKIKRIGFNIDMFYEFQRTTEYKIQIPHDNGAKVCECIREPRCPFIQSQDLNNTHFTDKRNRHASLPFQVRRNKRGYKQ